MLLTLSGIPAASPEALRQAVCTVITRQVADAAAPSVGPRTLRGRLPASTRLEQGAAGLKSESAEDAAAASHFAALLEAAFLVAAADGLADEERSALSELITLTVNGAIDAEDLDGAFDGFAANLEAQGLETRVDEVSSQFTDFMAREEALSFAALIAIADGELGMKEALVLIALGKRLDFSKGEVQATVDAVSFEVKRALELASQ